MNLRVIVLSGKVLLCAAFCLMSGLSANAGENPLMQCSNHYPENDAERLLCFDRMVNSLPAIAPSPLEDNPSIMDEENGVGERSYLTRVWNLDDLSNRDPSKLGRLHPYRQNYLLAKKTNIPNRQPYSPLVDHNVAAPKDIEAVEGKFQLSVKADIGDQRDINVFGIKTFRMWGAYTQQSDWQVFNLSNSSPFRETVYEPELIATLGTGKSSGLKLINIGWLHQSNGRTLPESRSWNRLYVLGGWEWNDMTSILMRGWWRIPEALSQDDNPDISDYLGRADVLIRWEPLDKSQAVALLIRNNLSKTTNRGYFQLDWAMPIRFGSAARIHLQLTSGYGESLIDYNYRQHTIGLGFSFREW